MSAHLLRTNATMSDVQSSNPKPHVVEWENSCFQTLLWPLDKHGGYVIKKENRWIQSIIVKGKTMKFKKKIYETILPSV